MNLKQKIAIAAGAATLTATGIAAAGSPPEAAEDGLTTAEEQVGVELPATKDAHPGGQSSDADATVVEAPEVEAPEVEAAAEGTGPVDNHGAEVSAVAQTDFPTGREHGEAVSEAARDNPGAVVRAAEDHPGQGGDDDDE